MAYTDSLQIRYFVGNVVTAGPGNVADLDSSLTSGIRCHAGATIVTFGIACSGAGTPTGQSQIYGVSVATSLADASGSLVATITVPSRLLVNGERFESGQFGARAARVLPGGKVIVSIQQPAGGGTGTFEPYVILRLEGYSAGLRPTGQTNPNSPLSVVFA